MITKEEQIQLQKINTLLRWAILHMTTTAGSGHPTSSLSAVELMSTLFYTGIFRYDHTAPRDVCNDRVIFSKGHAAPLYYALWAVGDVIALEELEQLRTFESRLEGHPTKAFPFTEVATGSLGQGLSVGVGFALAQKYCDKTPARSYVLLGDSEMAEGQVWEAIQIAAHYKLHNLIAIVDINRLGQRGETMLGHDVEAYAARVRSFGWRTVIVDGHDIAEIYRVYHDMIADHTMPLMIIAKTYKGKGISFLEDKYHWHGKVLDDDAYNDAVHELGDIDFTVCGTIAKPAPCTPQRLAHADAKHDTKIHIDPTQLYATRDGYGHALVALMEEDEKIVVLDAETSNSTRAVYARDAFPDRFFEMYIAEQNMVSTAAGLAQAGYVPFVSSFAAFLTRAHDQLRMANLSESRFVVCGSHCGVSIGADGASQMGLDDIALFRGLLDAVVLYPSDIIATQKILRLAYDFPGISYVRTTREKTPVLYTEDTPFVIGGSHRVYGDETAPIAIIGCGITVHEARKAATLLAHDGIAVQVIDLYGITPIDVNMLVGLIGASQHLIVVEDHYAHGGVGEAVCSALRNTYHGSFHHLCVTKMPHSGTPQAVMRWEKIDFNAIMEKVHMIKNNKTK